MVGPVPFSEPLVDERRVCAFVDGPESSPKGLLRDTSRVYTTRYEHRRRPTSSTADAHPTRLLSGYTTVYHVERHNIGQGIGRTT